MFLAFTIFAFPPGQDRYAYSQTFKTLMQQVPELTAFTFEGWQ
jgi:hypothetical protein